MPILRWFLLLLVVGWWSQSAAAEPVKTEPAKDDIPPLARNLRIAAEAVATQVNGQPLALIATRPTIEGDEALSAQANYLAQATTAAVLRAGIRGLDAEDGHPLNIAYTKGKLIGDILFKEADATYWQQTKKASFVLQSTLTPTKTGACRQHASA